MEKTERFLTVEQVAEMIGKNRQYLDDLRYRGQGPKYVKLGHRTIRYRSSDIEDWIAGLVHDPEAS